MKTIKNLVFDIGGVLADYRLKEFLAEKGFGPEMIRRILKASVLSPCWGQFERGEITEDEALEGFASSDPEIREELGRAYASVAGMLTAREYSIPLLKALKEAGFQLYYLSNYSKKAYDECGESLSFMPFMDGGLVSFQAHKTKPDPEMFTMFLEWYGLDAGECIFIDDTAENVEAAIKLGFTGIVFTSYRQLAADLSRFGVICHDMGEEPK